MQGLTEAEPAVEQWLAKNGFSLFGLVLFLFFNIRKANIWDQ